MVTRFSYVCSAIISLLYSAVVFDDLFSGATRSLPRVTISLYRRVAHSFTDTATFYKLPYIERLQFAAYIFCVCDIFTGFLNIIWLSVLDFSSELPIFIFQMQRFFRIVDA